MVSVPHASINQRVSLMPAEDPMNSRTIHAAAFALSVAGLAAAAPAAAQEDYPWAGFYVGATLGASWADTSTRLQASLPTGATIIPPGDIAQINALDSDSSNKTQLIGGVEGGYNYLMGSLLLGIETEFGFLDINEHSSRTFNSVVATTPRPTITIDQRVKTDWMWTLRPRIGYATPTWMVYATGGLAMTKIDYEATYTDTRVPPNTAAVDFSDTKTGWILGLGGAYAFTPNWSVKGEYLYASFGHVNGTSPTTQITLDTRERVKANILRMGVDYRF